MDPIELSSQIEEKYRRYLETMFFFKDPELRTSFKKALTSGHLSKGPYLEATPTFKREQSPRSLFQNLLGFPLDEGFMKAVRGDEITLYQHQEEAIKSIHQGHNIVVATGTASGKTEAFIFPILLHLYQEFQAGTLCPGVRALVLYPMNALANDQRDRLGEISRLLKKSNSPFQFTFGQYIGETPEHESDSRRYAQEHKARRLPGELIFRSEMRENPPHILLTNYSMLEYLLLRPDDFMLFDNGRSRWWKFLILDEAHQYRGARGIEMAMLIRRLKQRLKEGGQNGPFRCIATSATLVGEEKDKKTVANFATKLFGEEFRKEDIISGRTEVIPEPGEKSLTPEEYSLLEHYSNGENVSPARIADKLGIPLQSEGERARVIGHLLKSDHRAWHLRTLIAHNPLKVLEIGEKVFTDVPIDERRTTLSRLVGLLTQARDPASNAPLLSARYHLFLRECLKSHQQVNLRTMRRIIAI